MRRGGLRVDTTLNLKLQKAARKALVGHLGAPDRAGAIVTMDPKTGHILAMASSSQYANSKFNLAAQGHRQAGSTFKVMVLMDALNRGVDPNSTTYVSRHLEPGWLPSNPTYEVQTYSHGYKGRENRFLYRSHKKLGPIIRIGPKEVSVNCVDGGLKTIYGKGWEKSTWYAVFEDFG